jgi:phosphoribosylformylglycinamidine synthase
MKFIHNGYPQRTLNPADYHLSDDEKIELEKLLVEGAALEEFHAMIKRPNLGSVAPFMDKMDSTVQGLSVQHCIQGKGRISTSASCILVDIMSREGLVQAYGHAERQSYIDAEQMGKNSFLRAIGNAVALGGRLDYMIATDQALWQSSKKPEYQQMLIEANRGMSEVITGCEIPVISGKDTMFNQATVYDVNGNKVERGVFPTLHMTTFSKIDEVDNIVTVDVKKEGDLVYILGSETKDDMGGSEYYNMKSDGARTELNIGKPNDEKVNDVCDTFLRINKASRRGWLHSANYIEAGGLITAVKESATAGVLGIELDLNNVHRKHGIGVNEIMYGETEGRFLVSAKPRYRRKLKRLFKGKYSQIGRVVGENLVIRNNGTEIISEKVNRILEMYHKDAV